MAEFAVIGLGRFGQSVARNLARAGQQVLAVDEDADLVQAIASELDAAVCTNTTDEAALAGLHLERTTCVIVAIGAESQEASILTTALLRQAGVPRIVARAASALHARVLRAVGAHEVVNPEDEMGQWLARRLARPSVLEQVELGEGADMAEVAVPESFVGRSLVELDIRNRHDVSVVAVRHEGKVHANPRGTERFASGDVLIVIGAPQAIQRLAALA